MRTEPVPTTFEDAGPPNPKPGACSEPHAGQASQEHGSEPTGYQTIWHGDPDNNPHSRGGEILPGTDVGTMHPCATCQANAGNYL